MKKLTALLLVLALILTLSACSDGETQETGGNNTGEINPADLNSPPETNQPESEKNDSQETETPPFSENFETPETVQKNKMTIDLEFQDPEIVATAVIIPEIAEGEFSFVISNTLTIEEISNSSGSLEWTKERIELPFRYDLQKVTVETNSGDAITIKYSGRLQGHFTFLTDKKKTMDFHAAWYPQEFSFPSNIDNEIIVKISNLSDYTVVRGEYDEKNGQWIYSTKGFVDNDCNIIALKNGEHFYFSENGINIYYCDDKETKITASIAACTTDALKYYNEILYPNHERGGGIITIFSHSAEPGSFGGAYNRAGVFIYDGIGDINDISEDEFLIDGIPHEVAHFWASGADTNSWEDWLNETAAEWSALLYVLHTYGQETFDKIISMYIEYSPNFPPIKTEDGSRPYGVHNKGTVLFYEIYKEHGEDTIARLLNIFVSLDEKTTENFINEVSVKIGEDIAQIIREGIEKE
ncbi:MAG: hypothetical protein FWG44_08080 [Oscillospiraceae bacterium]|nr:hypothetical protein [Oscillospiraceae bacterium]